MYTGLDVVGIVALVVKYIVAGLFAVSETVRVPLKLQVVGLAVTIGVRSTVIVLVFE